MKALLIVLLVLAGCAKTPPAPRSNAFFVLDSGEGITSEEGGRAILSSWHGGLSRDQQILCVEPPLETGDGAWERFEACLSYLNGLIDLDTYRARALPDPGE